MHTCAEVFLQDVLERVFDLYGSYCCDMLVQIDLFEGRDVGRGTTGQHGAQLVRKYHVPTRCTPAPGQQVFLQDVL
jgi:hypothetical protein